MLFIVVVVCRIYSSTLIARYGTAFYSLAQDLIRDHENGAQGSCVDTKQHVYVSHCSYKTTGWITNDNMKLYRIFTPPCISITKDALAVVLLVNGPHGPRRLVLHGESNTGLASPRTPLKHNARRLVWSARATANISLQEEARSLHHFLV